MDPNGWVPLGPSCVLNGQLGYDKTGRGPVSGRVTAIVLDPADPDHVVYVGTALGGVWKTTDGGITWVPKSDDHLSLSVGAMAIDPNPPHNLYVASGEGNDGGEVFLGSGLTIYDPAADTWVARSHALLTPLRCNALVIDSRPPNPVRLLLATPNGLLESADNGVSWGVTPVIAGTPGRRVTSLAFDQRPDPTQSRLYAAVEGNGVYRKVGTAAFTALPKGAAGGLPNSTNIQRITLALCPGQPLTLYAVFADTNDGILGLYRSNDGGDLWQPVPVPTGELKQANYNLVLAVHPTNPDTLLLGETRLWRTTDAGQHWALISDPRGDSPGIHADQHAAVFHPTTPAKVWAGNDGGAWFSADGGDSWQHRNRGLQTLQYYALAQHPAQEVLLLAGSQDNGTQRFEGHPAWDLVGFGDGFYCAIDPQDSRYWYRSYVFHPDAKSGELDAIFRSDRAGHPDSWRAVVDGIATTDTTDRDPFYVPFVIDPSQTNVLYLGTTKLYRTDNRGDSWAPVQRFDNGFDFSTGSSLANVITAIAVNPKDSATVYVGTADGQFFHLHREANGKWTVNSRSGLPIAAYIGDIAVPSPPGAAPPSPKVYVAIGSPHLSWVPEPAVAPGRIFRSDDQGATWTNLGSAVLNLVIQGITVDHQSNPVNAIALDPANPTHVYLGCNVGVFKSTDEGAHWTAFRENLPNAAVADLQFHAARRLLRAATAGRSVWERPVDPPAAAGSGVDLYVRHNLLDVGRRPSPSAVPDPLQPDRQVFYYDGRDVRLDTPFPIVGGFQKLKGTVDFTPDGPIDFLGFEQLEHGDPRAGSTSRVYVQVTNRGPAPATAVDLRVFYAVKAGDNYPDLPGDFWAAFPNADPKDTSVWKPIGPKQSLGNVRPAEPRVVSLVWDVPSDLSGTVGLLCAVTGGAQDPVNETRLAVSKVAAENKHVVLKEVGVGVSSAAIVTVVALLVLVGVGVGVGLALRH
jgi:photosystem II stability/assembly factor-like uncharacterized protein